MAYLGKTPSQAVRSRYYFTASGGETSLSGTDDNGNTLTYTDGNYVDVSLNGVALVAGSDYNTTTANTIGGLTALTASDVVEVVVYDTFSVFSGAFTGDISLGDNVKAKFGAGDDLQIWHSGANSFISDAGTGNLYLGTDGTGINLTKGAGGESMATFVVDGAVTLYYDNAAKLATTATGIDVTGTVVTDGFELNTIAIGGDTFGAVKSANNTAAGFDFFGDSSGTKGARVYYEGNGNLFTVAENTSGTIEPRLVIDDSGNVGIGTTSPGGSLEVYKAGTSEVLIGTDNGGTAQLSLYESDDGTKEGLLKYDGTNNRIHLATSGAPNALVIPRDSGNVGIGTSSPGYSLQIGDGTASENMRINSSGTALISITSGTSSQSRLEFGDSADDDIGYIYYDNSSNSLQFATNTGERLRIDSNGRVGIGDTSPDSMLKIQSVSNVTGNAQLSYFYDSQNRLGNYRQNAHASFNSSMSLHYTNRSQNSAYNFLVLSSGGAADTEFSFRGDGSGFCDGSFNGGGADYAEYFEWDDGNSSDEDRRGYSVVLVGNKIRKATSSDAASDIIGVISATPAVTGDAAWDRWEGKYLTDDYGSYLKEAYTATAWTETDADGAETHHYYETDKIPADVTVPSDAVVTSTEEDGSLLMRRRLNPDYDDTQTYVPREERQEWDTVGLMGKLRLRAGQPTGDRWIKMRDIATDDDGNVTVEEWLVR